MQARAILKRSASFAAVLLIAGLSSAQFTQHPAPFSSDAPPTVESRVALLALVRDDALAALNQISPAYEREELALALVKALINRGQCSKAMMVLRREGVRSFHIDEIIKIGAASLRRDDPACASELGRVLAESVESAKPGKLTDADMSVFRLAGALRVHGYMTGAQAERDIAFAEKMLLTEAVLTRDTKFYGWEGDARRLVRVWEARLAEMKLYEGNRRAPAVIERYARLGATEDAERAARKAQLVAPQYYARMAELALSAGDLSLAEKLPAKASGYGKDGAYLAYAKRLWSLRRHDEAWEIVKALDESSQEHFAEWAVREYPQESRPFFQAFSAVPEKLFDKVFLLTSMAGTAAKEGWKADAVVYAQQAADLLEPAFNERLTEHTDHGEQTYIAMRAVEDLASVYIALDKFSNAWSLYDRSKHHRHSDNVLVAIAIDSSRVGQIEDMRKAVRLIANPTSKWLALWGLLASSDTKSDANMAAVELFREFIAQLPSHMRGDPIDSAVEQLAEDGLVREAVALLDLNKHEWWKIWHLRTIAIELAERGQYQAAGRMAGRAEALARRLGYSGDRTLGALAEAYAKAGRAEDAYRVSRRIELPQVRLAALTAILENTNPQAMGLPKPENWNLGCAIGGCFNE